MTGTPLDIAGQQLENAAKNRLRAEQAGLLRHTSIVRFVNAQLGDALKDTKKQKKARERSGVYVQGAPAVMAPDGYVRRSPVQQLRVDPGYRKRLIKKAVGAAVLLLLIAGAAALLIKYLAL